MKARMLGLAGILLSAGCSKNVSTNPRDTGGGGISWYENHSARRPGAAGTGSSSANSGQGPVQDSGTSDEPGNADSATESNGGQGRQVNPNALI